MSHESPTSPHYSGDDPDMGRANAPELEALHTEARQVPCPKCEASVGHRCRNEITRNATKIPHTQRSNLARDRIEAAGGFSVIRHGGTQTGLVPAQSDEQEDS